MDPRQTQYRFRGSVRPTSGIRASVLTPTATDGAEPGSYDLRIYDPIDSWGGEWGVSAKEFAASLDALPADATEIRLHINSPGGEVWEALAITNMLRDHRASVTAIVDGLAASAASFIAVAADQTLMAQDTQLMIHDAWGIAIGNAAVMDETSKLLNGISDNIAGIYARKSGLSVEEIRQAMLNETWLSAEESVAMKLADGIWDPKAAREPAVPADAKAAFDLSAFRYAGRNEAPEPALAAAPELEQPEPYDPARDANQRFLQRQEQQRQKETASAH